MVEKIPISVAIALLVSIPAAFIAILTQNIYMDVAAVWLLLATACFAIYENAKGTW